MARAINHPETAAGGRAAFVLASASPRRRRLLRLVGARFRIQPATVDETPRGDETAPEYAARAARDKALEVAGARARDPVVGADTVVEVDGELLGKPASAADAARMLRRLSGRVHRVHTAVALARGDRCRSILDSASVRFVSVDPDLIDWYVATGEPLDKAGGYALQGRGGVLVSEVEGSPHTVIGLPLHRLPGLFSELELDFWDFVDGAR